MLLSKYALTPITASLYFFIRAAVVVKSALPFFTQAGTKTPIFVLSDFKIAHFLISPIRNYQFNYINPKMYVNA